MTTSTNQCSSWVKNAIMFTSFLVFFVVIYAVQSRDLADNNLVQQLESANQRHHIELLRMTNIQRQDRLQRYCAAHNLTSRTYHQLRQEQMDHLIVDKQYKLLYCYIPKVSCRFYLYLFFDYDS